MSRLNLKDGKLIVKNLSTPDFDESRKIFKDFINASVKMEEVKNWGALQRELSFLSINMAKDMAIHGTWCSFRCLIDEVMPGIDLWDISEDTISGALSNLILLGSVETMRDTDDTELYRWIK